MLWRKLLAVVGGFLTIAASISAQDGWHAAGTSSDGWKASAATISIPTAPTVSTFRNVKQAASILPPTNAPVRFADYDERMQIPQMLPPSNTGPLYETIPPPKATLVPPGQPKAVIVYPAPTGMNRYPGVPDGTADLPPGFDPLLTFLRPRGQVWITPEYILWGTSGMKIPAIATSSAVGTSQAQTGVLGLPSTHLLFGDQSILNNWRLGIRVNTGFWLNDEQTFGTDMTFFYLGTKQRDYSASSAGDPLLARPFYDASTGMQSSQLVTYASRNADGTLSPVLVGTIGFRATTNFWGADFNFRRNLWDNDALRVDGLVGFRFLQLRDMLDVGSTVTANDPTAANGVAFGTTFTSLDQFYTRSDFYGGQVGLKGEYNMGRWSIGMLSKIALGNTYEAVSISGFSNSNVPGSPTQHSNGGLFAQSTNIGNYSANSFSVVPEFNFNLSYQLTDQIRLFAGYSVLYWSSVVRAGNQIDFTVNSTQIPTGGTNSLSGASRPAFIMHESGFWANGINIGAEFRW